MTTWALIANKFAGTRSTKNFWKKMDEKFAKVGITVEYFFTERVGHARELAVEVLKKGYTRLAVMGGDGTFSEVIDGLMKSKENLSNILVGLIPFGTGNDWGRYWKLDRNIDKSISVLANGVSTAVDVGKIDYSVGEKPVTRYFINAYGLGFDAKVLQLTNNLQHTFKGASWTYTLALFLTLFKHRSQVMEYEFDGGKTFKGLSYTASMGNGCYTGGGIKQTPEAVPNDGLLDIMVVENLSLMKIIKAIPLLFAGRLLEHDSVHLFKAKNVIARSAKPIISEVDGILQEFTNEIKVELLPKQINFLTPNS